MKRFETWSLALAPVLLFLFGSVSSASSLLVVNCGTVSGPTELVSAGILCPQFNLGGQLLSNINIMVSGGITGSITLTNGDNAAQTGSGTTTTGFNFGALAGFLFVNPAFSPSFTTGIRNLNAGQTLTVSGLSASGSGSLGNDTTSFAPYTGAGNFSIPVSTSTFFSSGGTGGFFFSAQASSANATAVVTYTYDAVPNPNPNPDPIPEPATMSLLGLGLGLIGVRFIPRRFKTKRGLGSYRSVQP